jgi:hypothetical protein
MKKETRRLANGLEVEVTTHDTGTVVVEEKDKGGRVVELHEFYNLEEADKFVAGLVRAGPGEDPALKKREERFRKMGLSESEAVVAARDDRTQDA